MTALENEIQAWQEAQPLTQCAESDQIKRLTQMLEFHRMSNPTINADAWEILERLYLKQKSNSVGFCVNDFSFGCDRFIRALDSLLRNDYIDTLFCLLKPLSVENIIFSFKDKIHANDTKVEIIQTVVGREYVLQKLDSTKRFKRVVKKNITNARK